MVDHRATVLNNILNGRERRKQLELKCEDVRPLKVNSLVAYCFYD